MAVVTTWGPNVRSPVKLYSDKEFRDFGHLKNPLKFNKNEKIRNNSGHIIS